MQRTEDKPLPVIQRFSAASHTRHLGAGSAQPLWNGTATGYFSTGEFSRPTSPGVLEQQPWLASCLPEMRGKAASSAASWGRCRDCLLFVFHHLCFSFKDLGVIKSRGLLYKRSYSGFEKTLQALFYTCLYKRAQNLSEALLRNTLCSGQVGSARCIKEPCISSPLSPHISGWQLPICYQNTISPPGEPFFLTLSSQRNHAVSSVSKHLAP